MTAMEFVWSVDLATLHQQVSLNPADIRVDPETPLQELASQGSANNFDQNTATSEST